MVSYLLSAPAAPVRQLLLAQTGHSYLPRAIAVAVALAAAALIGAVLRGAVRGWRAVGDPLTLSATFRRLAMGQAAGFVILEFLERRAAGASLAGLGNVLPRGLLVQVVVAAVAATALWLLDRAGEGVVRALDGHAAGERYSALVWIPARRLWPASSIVWLGSISLRGPPLLARR